MGQCSTIYTLDGTETRRCPRTAHPAASECVFHLTPEDRAHLGVSSTDLRTGFRSDVSASTDRRREYVDITIERFDLGSLLIDGKDVGPLRFQYVLITGTLSFEGSVVRHPIEITDSQIGQLDCTGVTFEHDVAITDSIIGDSEVSSVGLRCRRASFERGLSVSATEFCGVSGFAGCRVRDWLDLDSVTFYKSAYFPNASLQMAQFINVDFRSDAVFTDLTGTHVTFDKVSFAVPPNFSEAQFDTIRMYPSGDTELQFSDATLLAGRLQQPDAGQACYDLTDATVGDIDIDCTIDTFDRYRFYRTRFDGFPFARYREFFRAN